MAFKYTYIGLNLGVVSKTFVYKPAHNFQQISMTIKNNATCFHVGYVLDFSTYFIFQMFVEPRDGKRSNRENTSIKAKNCTKKNQKTFKTLCAKTQKNWRSCEN